MSATVDPSGLAIHLLADPEPGEVTAVEHRPGRRPVRLSVVVPCYNEAGNIEALRVALVDVLPQITADCEVLLVDDGSTDATLAEVRRVSAADPRFRYLSLSRNFGKEAAILAGLSHAAGTVVAIMDADLQHPPELLRTMVPLLDQGYDQVVARRDRTGDPPIRRWLSRTYYAMINRVAEVELRDGVGDFRVLSARAVRALLSLGESCRFSKGLFAWIGFDTAVVDYANVPRRNGGSRFTVRTLIGHGVDGVVSFSSKPLRGAVYVGAAIMVLALGYAGWVVLDALIFGSDLPGYPTLMAGVAGLGGLQLLFLGVIGEYLARIYRETKARPHFLIKDASGPAPSVTVALGPAVGEAAGTGGDGRGPAYR